MSSFYRYLLTGALGFGISSLLVFTTVAFAERQLYEILGLTGAYIFWTLLFIVAGGTALSSLARNSVSIAKFLLIFGSGFLAYAILWISAYFWIGGMTGEWAGSFSGSIVFGVILAAGLGSLPSTPAISGVLFVANSIGYFLGSMLNAAFGGVAGMLLWGVAYGMFFGAGLGISLYLVRSHVREAPLKAQHVD